MLCGNFHTHTRIYTYARARTHTHTNITLTRLKSLIRLSSTGWRRPIGYLIFIGHFLQKSPIISGSFATNDLQLKAFYESSPPCNIHTHKHMLSWNIRTYARMRARAHTHTNSTLTRPNSLIILSGNIHTQTHIRARARTRTHKRTHTHTHCDETKPFDQAERYHSHTRAYTRAHTHKHTRTHTHVWLHSAAKGQRVLSEREAAIIVMSIDYVLCG